MNPMRVGFGAVLARLSGAKASLLLMFRCFLHRNVPDVMVGESCAIQWGQPESHGINDKLIRNSPAANS